MKRKNHPLRIGVIAAVAAFIALSVFAGGFIEISRDAGLARWFTDTAVYLIVNKFGSKLFASLVIGCGAAFANSMIAYGRPSSPKSVRGRPACGLLPAIRAWSVPPKPLFIFFS